MPRLMRRSFLVLALLGAWALLARDHAPLPLTVGEAVAGPAGRSEGSSDVVRNGRGPPHDLSALRVFTKVDPLREGQLRRPQAGEAQGDDGRRAGVRGEERPGRAGGRQRRDRASSSSTSTASSASSTSATSTRCGRCRFTLKDVFDFIAKNMRPIEDTRDIEYAAVNGMLSTLDPHSVLLQPEMYREMKLTTKGEFGGLGFVIQMKEGNLTVVKVLPKTPALRARASRRTTGSRRSARSPRSTWTSTRRCPSCAARWTAKVTITVERKGWDKPHADDPHPRHHLHRVGAVTSCSPATWATSGSRTSRATPPATCRPRCGELQSEAEAKGGTQGPGARPARQPRRPARAGDPGLRPLRHPGHHRRHRGLLATSCARRSAPTPTTATTRYPIAVLVNAGQRLGLGDRRRRAEEPEPRGDHRPADLRQGLACRCSTTSRTTARSSSPSPST